jgi:glycosyltransferase involved in cell wall biosynthesis
MISLLTIAIPTYNRGYILEKTLLNLQNILDLNNTYRSCVEVLISNNGSIDNTKEILSKYSFKYFNQNKNIGYDENILFLYKQANSEYILFLSDDDILLHSGFVCLMNKLTNKIYDLILCNYYSIENGIKVNAFEIFKEIPIESNFMKIASLTPFYFLSGFVIRKIKIVDNVKFLKGTYARQMDICLHILDDKSKYFIMNEFLVEFNQNGLTGGCNIGPYEYRIHAGFSKIIFKYSEKFSYHYRGINILMAYLSGIINLNRSGIKIHKMFVILINILMDLFKDRSFFSFTDLFEVIFKKIKNYFNIF